MEEKIECQDCGKRFSVQEALEQHRKAKHEEMKKKGKLKLPMKWIAVTAIVIVIAAGGYILVSSAPKYTPVSEYSEHFLGAENAPVVVIEYSDFQCPFCGRFYQQTEPQIISEYVDTGKVKLVYRHFPLAQTHQYAQKAAEASECASDQGKFWEYHDRLFDNQNALFPASLKKYAADIGLDRAAFDACLDSGAMASRVKADFEDGQGRGVRSTPTFFVNNVMIVGAQPFSSFKQAIESELGKI
ncbi:MAG: DsbA family protein [Candidatus Aenigmarchaeota archaeon]|nr:DsbA family protein [Candidatus Aenigmarchaeota archaeon]